MGDIGGHALALLVGFCQVGAHLVEGGGQLSQLVLRGDRHLLLQVTSGTPLCKWNLRNEFVALSQAAGVLRIRFHDLRHTAASLMLSHGVEPFVVSRRLGHSTIQITMDLYGHLLPGAQKEAARLMSDLVRPIRVDREVE